MKKPRVSGAAVRPRSLHAWTLRTRLLAAVIALLAAVCLVIGVVSVLAMKFFMEQKVDDQLTFAVKRSRVAAEQRRLTVAAQQSINVPNPGSLPRGNGGFPFGAGQGEGTVGLFIDSTGTVAAAGVVDTSGETRPLTAAQQAQVVATPRDEKPHTYDLSGHLGSYRLLAQRTPSGEVIVTGLPLAPAHSAELQLALVITGISLIGLLAAAGAGAAIVRVTLKPLRRVAATATQVSELPLDRGEVALGVRVPEHDTDQRTEVGQVGSALNRLLGHVSAALSARHASEARVRQFVADASHELRTPLAAIRGYAELTRRGGQNVPPDVAHALGRVESEAIRMTTLVDDLLLLARLDEGRPMDRAPVDLSLLLMDAISDAHAAGPDHRWQLELPDEPVEIMGDAARLHQVIANILANARVHTPTGTTVLVSLTVPHGSAAVVTVLDDGPGIAGGLLPEVFERFARGDSSRSREAGSTGLGLAIVAAVVQAHGGEVTVESAPGRTAFILQLPADGIPERPSTPAITESESPDDASATDETDQSGLGVEEQSVLEDSGQVRGRGGR